MNSRKLVGLFFKTLLIGGATSLIASFFVSSSIYADNLNPVDWVGLIGLFLWYIVYGLLYSIVSQAGFFAYLFIHRFGLSMFRSFWPTVQIGLIIFVVFDLIYFPYKATDGTISIFWFILMALSILVFGLIIAMIKAKQTHARAFIPALFLMVVITAIEWVPGLRTEGTDYATLMILSLLACNTYQLLVLHKLSGSPEEGKQTRGKKTSRDLKGTPKKA